MTVRDIMTPRTVILAFPQDWTSGQILDAQDELPVSRLPVYEGSIDHITGFVLKSDLLLAQARGQADTVLADLRRDIRVVLDTASLSHLLELLASNGEHIALVVGEYGGTEGLVTMEDVFETLLGLEIVDEADAAVDMQRLARERWEKRAKRLGLEVADASDNASSAAGPTDNPSIAEPGRDSTGGSYSGLQMNR